MAKSEVVIVRDSATGLEREYSLEVHGKNFKELAEEFASKVETREILSASASKKAASAAADDTEDEDEGDEYDAMGSEDLKTELRDRGLPVSGKVDELRERLRADDEKEEEDDKKEDDE